MSAMDTSNRLYCRFCATKQTENNILDLKVYSYAYKEIEEKLLFFKADYIDLSNNLPLIICITCNTSLDTAYDFMIKVKKSQSALLEMCNQNCEVKVERLDTVLEKQENDDVKAESWSEEDSRSEDGFAADEMEASSVTSKSNEKVDEGLDFMLNYNGVPMFLDETVDVKSWSSYTWYCTKCDGVFTDVQVLREHSENTHNCCANFKCADCDVLYGAFEEFVSHVRGHWECLRNYCEYCNFNLEPETKSKHMKSHRKHYICLSCGKLHDSMTEYKQHVNKVKAKKRKTLKKEKEPAFYVMSLCESDSLADKSWLGYPWTCRSCDTSFDSLQVLREHSKEVHKTCFSNKCVDCEETVDSYKGFVYHVRRHRQFLKQYCHYCNFKYEEGAVDTDHTSTHFSEDQKVCEGCGEIFHSRDDFNSHVANFNPPKVKYMPYMKREHPLNIDDFSCDVCGKVMKTLNSLRRHRELHTERMRNYTCEVCGKAFFTKGALTSHMVTHSEMKPEVCQICKKSFKTLRKLKQHVITHNAIKPFKCEICFRCFKKKSQLTDHMLIHSNEMPFQCQYCEKAFKHRSNLKTHLNQHTGARPYVCSDCGMDFTNWANCNKHMKRKHGTSLAQNTVTPYGKVPINPKNGKPKKMKDLHNFKEWTEMILAPRKRGKKTKNSMEDVVVSQDVDGNDTSEATD